MSAGLKRTSWPSRLRTARALIASSAQRKPGATITAMAKAEVDYLLSRVARVDKRASFAPQSAAM